MDWCIKILKAKVCLFIVSLLLGSGFSSGAEGFFDPIQYLENSKTLKAAQAKLEMACENRHHELANEYAKEKSNISRNLKSLDAHRKDKSHRLKRAAKKYQKKVRKLNKSCRKSLAKLEKLYREKRKKKGVKSVKRKKSKRNATKSIKGDLEDALHELSKDCERRETEARRRFFRKKRKIGRSLDSLDRHKYSKRNEVNRQLKNFENEVERIHAQCKEKEGQIITAYRKKDKREAVALKKKMEAERRAQRQKKQQEFMDLFKNWRFRGEVREEVAYRISKPHEPTKIKTQLLLSQSTSITDDLNIRFSQRGWLDAVFTHTDTYPPNVEDDQQSKLELRDAYMDYSQGPFDFRLGKQQIVWGETVGLFIADVVNGRDLREYILPDFNLIRRPQWSADVAFSHEMISMELFTSIPEFNLLGVQGSEFEFPTPLPSGVPVVVSEPSEPRVELRNLETGGRLSYLTHGWDLGVFGLYGWEKSPVLFKKPIPVWPPTYEQEYMRQSRFGSTFSKEVHDVIFKGEAVVSPRSYFTSTNTSDKDRVTRNTVINSVLSMDYTLFGELESNFQWLHRIIPDADEHLVNEKDLKQYFSVWIRFDMWNGKIEPEILWIRGLTEWDVLWRPKVGYRMTDSLLLDVGADIFEGHPNTGLFGIFEDRDRAFVELSYSF
jgi:hypothetical protein